jgi:hypothetical protein
MIGRRYRMDGTNCGINHPMSPEFSVWVKRGSDVGGSGQAGFGSDWPRADIRALATLSCL